MGALFIPPADWSTWVIEPKSVTTNGHNVGVCWIDFAQAVPQSADQRVDRLL
jgi:hypothetical protein